MLVFAENLYLVMEYLPGGDLGCLLANFGCLEEHDARFYASEIVMALQHLHG